MSSYARICYLYEFLSDLLEIAENSSIFPQSEYELFFRNRILKYPDLTFKDFSESVFHFAFFFCELERDRENALTQLRVCVRIFEYHYFRRNTIISEHLQHYIEDEIEEETFCESGILPLIINFC